MMVRVLCAAAMVLAGCSASTGSTPTPGDQAVEVSGAVRVAAVGDIACDPDAPTYTDCHHDETAELIRSQDVDALLALGDLQYDKGAADDWPQSYDETYGPLLDKTYPVPGNHEYLTPGAVPYFEYFGTRAGDPDKGYYAFDLGEWRVYALNAECNQIDCAAERTWLVDDIREHQAACQLLFTHAPRYSSGEHGSSTRPERFWAVAYNAGFELALAGHDHDYERFAEMDYAGNVVSTGIRSFVSGAGGRSLYAFESREQGSQVQFGDDYGVLFLALGSGSYSWEYRTISGETIDQGSDTCHGRP